MKTLSLFLMLGVCGVCLPLHAAPNPIDSGAPSVHPLDRYGELWDSGWFVAPQDAAAVVEIEPVVEEPFLYRLVGVADLRGRQWVYLSDEAGKVIELTFGRPAVGLSLVRIEGAATGGERTIVQLRQGARLIPLELDSEAHAPLSEEQEGGRSVPQIAGQSRPDWVREVLSRK